jgi:hypothetical protein
VTRQLLKVSWGSVVESLCDTRIVCDRSSSREGSLEESILGPDCKIEVHCSLRNILRWNNLLRDNVEWMYLSVCYGEGSPTFQRIPTVHKLHYRTPSFSLFDVPRTTRVFLICI